MMQPLLKGSGSGGSKIEICCCRRELVIQQDQSSKAIMQCDLRHAMCSYSATICLLLIDIPRFGSVRWLKVSAEVVSIDALFFVDDTSHLHCSEIYLPDMTSATRSAIVVFHDAIIIARIKEAARQVPVLS